MGLLLGASTLTICELLDFLALMLYKRFKQQTTISPGKHDDVVVKHVQ